jgi:hypothetical protein
VAGAAQDLLDGPDAAEVVEVGRVQVEAQEVAGEARADADDRG